MGYEYETIEGPARSRFKTVHADGVKENLGAGWRGIRVGADDPDYGGEGRTVAEVADEHRKDLVRAGHAAKANVTVKVADQPDENGRLLVQFNVTAKGTKPRKAAAGAAQLESST